MPQPLDKTQALLYGKFVQAAYTMYKTPGPDPMRPEPQDIPDGYELGAWIHMSDFFLNIEDPKFYGIVAFDKANPDSRVIAIRGTEGSIEWFDDAFAVPVPFRQVPAAGRVACGFDKIYSTLKVIKRKLPSAVASKAAAQDATPETFSGSFGDQLEQLARSREVERGFRASLADTRERPPRPTVVTGHSLGGALTTLFVMENSSKHKFDIQTLCSFASPRVGNMEFVRTFDQLPINSWRIVNTRDLVPKLPPHIPILLDYDHVNTPYPFDSSSFARNSLECWHSMNTYLHSLDTTYPLLAQCAP
jgi:hypothetical protein